VAVLGNCAVPHTNDCHEKEWLGRRSALLGASCTTGPIQTAPLPPIIVWIVVWIVVRKWIIDLFFWNSGDFSSVQLPQPQKASGPCAVPSVGHLLAVDNGARQQHRTSGKGRRPSVSWSILRFSSKDFAIQETAKLSALEHFRFFSDTLSELLCCRGQPQSGSNQSVFYCIEYFAECFGATQATYITFTRTSVLSYSIPERRLYDWSSGIPVAGDV
jgi:hypothetical protein